MAGSPFEKIETLTLKADRVGWSLSISHSILKHFSFALSFLEKTETAFPSIYRDRTLPS